jgi:hypothetical protein
MESRPLPRYWVSSPHQVRRPTSAGSVLRPFDLWHARVLGQPLTVCGTWAVTWSFFWDLRFDEGGESQCPACRQALAIRGSSAYNNAENLDQLK